MPTILLIGCGPAAPVSGPLGIPDAAAYRKQERTGASATTPASALNDPVPVTVTVIV